MVEVQRSGRFKDWLNNLADLRARKKIAQRLVRVELGLLGDAKYFDGIGELRVDYGPGYRLYFTRRGSVVIIMLCGGDKSSQERDIRLAKQMAEEI